jgi:ATP-dependent helicase HrpB
VGFVSDAKFEVSNRKVSLEPLPIDPLLPRVIESLRSAPNLVIEAPPGAGKTTRVPPALLDTGIACEREVWVLEPRRLAARLSAKRVADERGERLGETVGYQVRFEESAGPKTRIRFLTEGVFTRRLLADPQLSRAGIVILDEFHERHLQSDLALALLKRLQQGDRSDLRIVVMSATLEAAPVARFLNDCPVLRSEGRRFPVEIEHEARPDERPLELKVQSAIARLLNEGLEGDVLVFLPGAAEIRRAQKACAGLTERFKLLLLPLHGDLAAADQERAVSPSPVRKIILSTNVAETSVTIEGVSVVIDSGLARVAGHSPWSGLPTLQLARTSRASAAQRAGRSGRTRAGRCLRLYTAQDFAQRAEHEPPEIQRLDLSEAALDLHAAGIRDLQGFEWFEAPERGALEAAENLLGRLGAIDDSRRVTETGARMSVLPLHPRLSRMVAEAVSRKVGAEACLIAALVSERDMRARNILEETGERLPRAARSVGSSDLLELFDLFMEARRASFNTERLKRLGLDPGAVKRVERVRRQLERLTRCAELKEELSVAEETELLISILSGYPDRVARRRTTVNEAGAASASIELQLSNGQTASLAPESVVRSADFMVCVDAEEQRAPGRGGRRAVGRTVVRTASAIEPDWLLDLFTGSIKESVQTEWNPEAERVETVRRLMYDELVLDESRAVETVSDEVTQKLAAQALLAGVEAFVDGDALRYFLSRVGFMRRTFPEKDFPALDEADVRASLAALCEGRHSFSELREAVRAGELFNALRQRLSSEQSSLLERMATERVRLLRGRNVRVNYEDDKPPWIASRLQDFFGMKEGPVVAGGRVALVLHLLAPNNRPVQVTSDLAGFWERHYPSVRRELSRRYPRHAWPEDPMKKDFGL